MADVMQRILALLAVLQSGKTFTGEELAARLDVPPRTLRRDINRLRGYGYPVETQPGPGGYYRLTAGRTMPPLLLDDDEAIATLLGLAALGATGDAREGSVDDAAIRAYGKVDQYLPKRLRPRLAALRTSLETTPTPTPSISAETMSTLAEAIAHERVVTFHYVGADGTATTRNVEPYRQIHLLLRWYLLGWDTGKEDWRVFRIDRVSELQAQSGRFAPRALPAGTGVDYLRQGINRNRQRVVVTIDAPMTEVADAFAHEDIDLTAAAGGGTHAVLMLDSWQWLLPRLAFLDADFRIEEPAEFREVLRRFGARLGRQ
ncbi:helix-turn-helix transcriptional regulator [Streptomyces botrytidirepellens]|uniref:YafY family transcriptional regulator n=1 Tax=Streptomyces botrytidirepellens TaxID=2486417 RepID=A0A3M8VYI7_9ACTN|nr:YafY family protein [Streptomyces botrytidirepellens]RNG22207.1 YafY family transcriptional regulator [Streptomyces botrytidirepellens]